MIRQDDSYVGLYERAYIANNLNAALFLSVHNNAMDDRSYAGTMTLYYSKSSGSGFNGYKFAQIVQRNLLSKLGTIDRSVRERPNLVVLKATAMPSALAEVAFMTNESDRMNLQNEAFRMKAAEALCNAVIESLKQVY
jgi:N-acetylmuramoyl-L-alanine amidase